MDNGQKEFFELTHAIYFQLMKHYYFIQYLKCFKKTKQLIKFTSNGTPNI